LFPVGVLLTYLFFWNVDHRGAVLAGIAALALADPAAALIGTRFGQRRFERWAHGRSLEGSLAFLAIAGVTSAWIAASIPGGAMPIRIGVGCGLAGAVAEAVSPPGYDNVTVPVLVAAAYGLLA
jgi:phytol kinase